MTKLELLNEIKRLVNIVYENRFTDNCNLYEKMNKEVFAKNLNGRYYIPKNTKKEVIENVLEDLINLCYDNHILYQAYEI